MDNSQIPVDNPPTAVDNLVKKPWVPGTPDYSQSTILSRDVKQGEKIVAAAAQRAAREILDESAPNAARVLVDNIAQLAEHSKFITVADISEDLTLTSNQKVRHVAAHNRLAVSASKVLLQYTNQVLAYSLGHPVQGHEVRSSAELTETQETLRKFGAGFLVALQQILSGRGEFHAASEPETVEGEVE